MVDLHGCVLPIHLMFWYSDVLRAAMDETQLHRLAEEMKVDKHWVEGTALDRVTGNRPHQVRTIGQHGTVKLPLSGLLSNGHFHLRAPYC